MKCSRCNKNATIHTTYGENSLCNRHFLEIIEKRIRKNLRTNHTINTKQTYYLKNKNPTETEIATHFLRNIFGKHIKITAKNTKKAKTIQPASLDKEADTFIESFLKNKPFPKKNNINPTKTLLESDINHLARILRIKNKPEKHNQILESLEKKYPGTKFSVMKSKEFIQRRK